MRTPTRRLGVFTFLCVLFVFVVSNSSQASMKDWFSRRKGADVEQPPSRVLPPPTVEPSSQSVCTDIVGLMGVILSPSPGGSLVFPQINDLLGPDRVAAIQFSGYPTPNNGNAYRRIAGANLQRVYGTTADRLIMRLLDEVWGDDITVSIHASPEYLSFLRVVPDLRSKLPRPETILGRPSQVAVSLDYVLREFPVLHDNLGERVFLYTPPESEETFLEYFSRAVFHPARPLPLTIGSLERFAALVEFFKQRDQKILDMLALELQKARSR